MRKLPLIAAGVVFTLIGVGFICPQVANLRMNGSLLLGQLTLLLLGGSVTLTGLVGIAYAGRATR